MQTQTAWITLTVCLAGICLGLVVFGIKEPLTEWWATYQGTGTRPPSQPAYPICIANRLWKTETIALETYTLSVRYPITWKRNKAQFIGEDDQKIAELIPTTHIDAAQSVMTLGDTTAAVQIEGNTYRYTLTHPPIALIGYAPTANSEAETIFRQVAASLKKIHPK